MLQDDEPNEETTSPRLNTKSNNTDHRIDQNDQESVDRRLSETQTELRYQPYFSTVEPEAPVASIIGEVNDSSPDPPVKDIAEGERRMSTQIGEPMLRTVISNGKDALDLLFEAAQKDSMTNHTVDGFSQENNNQVQVDDRSPQGSILAAGEPSLSPAHSSLYGASIPCAMSTNLSKDLLETWRAYRFVTTGWLSPEEAVTYVDLYVYFFHNGTFLFIFHGLPRIHHTRSVLIEFALDSSKI